jgi:hypothetical protein
LSWPDCYSARMESAALEVGRLYAYRENPRAKSEMLKVKLIAKVGRGGKVKIRFEDGPHPGLEEYIRTANLIVNWVTAKRFSGTRNAHNAPTSTRSARGPTTQSSKRSAPSSSRRASRAPAPQSADYQCLRRTWSASCAAQA